MKAAFRSDVGRKREANEDWLQVDEKYGLAILADGMGGHQAGEVASRLAAAVGISGQLVPDRNQIALQVGDLVLLCSDGLTDMLTDEEIEGTIRHYGDHLDKAIDALIEEANHKGGRDNISVVLVQYAPASAVERSHD